jgi:hypothetical protein
MKYLFFLIIFSFTALANFEDFRFFYQNQFQSLKIKRMHSDDYICELAQMGSQVIKIESVLRFKKIRRDQSRLLMKWDYLKARNLMFHKENQFDLVSTDGVLQIRSIKQGHFIIKVSESSYISCEYPKNDDWSDHFDY